MKYVVIFKDLRTGASSYIDLVEACEGYSADQYIADCKEYADDDWNKMLSEGIVTLKVYE